MFCLFSSAVVREMVLGAVLEIPEFHLADHLREYFFLQLYLIEYHIICKCVGIIIILMIVLARLRGFLLDVLSSVVVWADVNALPPGMLLP